MHGHIFRSLRKEFCVENRQHVMPGQFIMCTVFIFGPNYLLHTEEISCISYVLIAYRMYI